MIRKSFTVFLVFLISMVFTACSHSKESSGNIGSTDKKVTLKIWFTNVKPDSVSKNDWWMTKAIKIWEEQNPNTKIDLVQQGGGENYDALFKAASIAGNGPDVANLFTGGNIMSNKPYIEPLDGYLSQDTLNSLSGWDTVKEDFDTKGKILAVPYGAGMYFYIFYNKELFKKAGLDENQNPSTWEDLLNLSEKLKNSGITPFAVGEKEGYTSVWILNAIVGAQIGTEGFFNMLHGKLPINDSSMVKGYEEWKKVYDRGFTSKGVISKAQAESKADFMSGKAAMYIAGGWENTDIQKALGNNVDIFPIPSISNSKYPKALAGGPSYAYVIMKSSKKKEQAAKFIEFLVSAKIQDMRVEQEQTEASNHKNANLELVKSPLLHKQSEWLKDRQIVFPMDNIMPQEFNDFLYRTSSQVFANKMNAVEAADALQKEYQKIIARQK